MAQERAHSLLERSPGRIEAQGTRLVQRMADQSGYGQYPKPIIMAGLRSVIEMGHQIIFYNSWSSNLSKSCITVVRSAESIVRRQFQPVGACTSFYPLPMQQPLSQPPSTGLWRIIQHAKPSFHSSFASKTSGLSKPYFVSISFRIWRGRANGRSFEPEQRDEWETSHETKRSNETLYRSRDYHVGADLGSAFWWTRSPNRQAGPVPAWVGYIYRTRHWTGSIPGWFS